MPRPRRLGLAMTRERKDADWLFCFGMDSFEGAESGRIVFKEERDFSDGAITMFGDDDIDDIFIRGIGLHAVFTVEKHDDIGVLFDRARFAEVGEFWYLIRARFNSTRELRESDDRDIEFTRELFESAGDLGYFLNTIVTTTRAPFH